MKLSVYKGFSIDFLNGLSSRPLIDTDVHSKVNVLAFDKKTRKHLNIALMELEDEDVWVTYEEYSLIQPQIDEEMREDGLRVTIYRNNIYPDYYPLPFEISDTLADEIIRTLNGDNSSDTSDECKKIISIYNAVINVDGTYYGCFCNYECEKENDICVKDYFPRLNNIKETQLKSEYNIFLNDDVATYLRDLKRIAELKPSIIGVKSSGGYVSNKIQDSLQAFCLKNNIQLIRSCEILPADQTMEKELVDIARNDMGITGFVGFRKIKFYKNPDIDKEIIELSQAQIIQEIINQAEQSYDNNSFRDIFITASTGAGKSVMFQIPAVYLAKKYNKLTIVIEPVKALMQDQKEKLNKNGYSRVEAFNSDLISQVEKEEVIRKIKDGEIDLLYLSPETLLAYSIETIIGDREIGLMIVDEAHTVTTWGVGFRPDYWYLGGYINRLRNQVQTTRGMHRKIYHFPVCAFTATAVNGGNDNSVSDTVISLYMENPIKYIGYVRRDDIKFDIVHMGDGKKLPKSEYEEAKTKALEARIRNWLAKNEKTIVYFPYATLANDAAKGIREFSGITVDKRIGTYTGRNVNELSTEAFNETKRQTFEAFRNGNTPVMLATKAFGMGVDVDDVQNVYHYAVTGNLCDYVQEIGRAARKNSINGMAITDYFPADIKFMNQLFGMSQIRQYQIKAVIEGIYNTYKSKKCARSFLISPESFTYIFNGKGADDERKSINKLKTCLLMLEKDLYDKNNFKVIISRPQSVFTKAYVCIRKEDEASVLSSKYERCFEFLENGRYNEKQANGTTITDFGDIYSIDLKEIWENYYPNISFPQFKYWYFNPDSKAKDKVVIMPEIRAYFVPRQKVNIEVRRDLFLSDLRQNILNDFEFIADTLYKNFGKCYFTQEDMKKLLHERFGSTNSNIISNSLFDLVDPQGLCVKRRANEAAGKMQYSLSNGNFKEFMRKPVIKSSLVSNLSKMTDKNSYSGFISLTSNVNSVIALKLLSIFDYITYEVLGGAEPEIFIRLNDPNKLRNIVTGKTYYSNNYVEKAKQKHDRDVQILLHFFNDLQTDSERWNYIEDYFLGYDVLSDVKPNDVNTVNMSEVIDKDHCYQTDGLNGWNDVLGGFIDSDDIVFVKPLIEKNVCMPEYIQTKIKSSDVGDFILMSWPSKNTLICYQDTPDSAMQSYSAKGWHAHKLDSIDIDCLKEELK